jgi:hypothetical protein
VFSVSHSGVGQVAKYIAEQEQHHRKRSFADELRLLVERYGLKWRDDKTVSTRILHFIFEAVGNSISLVWVKVRSARLKICEKKCIDSRVCLGALPTKDSRPGVGCVCWKKRSGG